MQQDYLTKERNSQAEEWEAFQANMKDQRQEADRRYNEEYDSIDKRYKEATIKLESSHAQSIIN